MNAKNECNRRDFMAGAVAKWTGLLGLFGFRLHAYANPIATGWNGWIEWCGRLMGFVRLNGSILWWR